MHEVTYDDPETYKVKYNWAKQRGFKGLAFW
jgi:GH18 family chitinase